MTYEPTSNPGIEPDSNSLPSNSGAWRKNLAALQHFVVRDGDGAVKHVRVKTALSGANPQAYLGAIAQFYEREGHAQIPRNHVETFNGEDLELGLWASIQKEAHSVGSLPAQRVMLLESLPGWVWGHR